MEISLLRYRLDNQVAIISMDDTKSNALSPAMMKELSAAFTRAESEADAVILEGRQGRFSTGFDSKLMMGTPNEALGMVKEGCDLLMRIYEFPKPVVMSVTGHALAAGILLAATGDIRIGAKGLYKIGLNEVKYYIPIPVFGLELARDRLSPSELVAATIHGKTYSPDTAADAGWLDRIVAPEQLADEAMREAKRLASLSSTAYRVTKSSLRRRTINYVRNRSAENFDELRACLPIKR